MTKNRAKRSADLDLRGPDLTAESVTSLLYEVLGSSIQLPPIEELRIFAGRMNLIRSNVKTAQTLFRDSHAKALAAQKAIPIVLASLQSQRDSLVCAVEILTDAAKAVAAEPASITQTNIAERCLRYRAALEAGDRVIADLARIENGDEWFVRVEDKPRFPDNWTDHFHEILGTTKRLASLVGIGTGKTRGHYPKLLAAMVLKTTGQTVSEETIYEHIPAVGA